MQTMTDTSTDSETRTRREALEERVRRIREEREARQAEQTKQPGSLGALIPLADFLSKRGYEPPRCSKCRDSGVVADAMAYTPDGIMATSAVCDCDAGAAKRAEIEAQQREMARRRAAEKQRRILRLFGQSGLPSMMAEWSLDTYPGDARLVQLARQYLATGELRDGDRTKRGLLLIGPSGTGKTGLAVGILRAMIEQGVPSLFVETGAFLRRIRSTFDRNSELRTEEVTKAALEIDFLVLDDIGDAGRGGTPASDFARGEVFSLVNHRHNEMLATIFTSNLTARELAQQFGERTWWRMAEMCMVCQVSGKNLRA